MKGHACRSGCCTGTVTADNPKTSRCERCRTIMRSGIRRMYGDRSDRKAMCSYGAHVSKGKNVVKMRSEPKHIPKKLGCKICCDMPWARGPGRRTEQGSGLVMASFKSTDGWRCKGCKELYEDEAPPELNTSVRSSAAFLAEAGELHGHVISREDVSPAQTAKNKEYKRRSLAKKAEQARFLAIGKDWEESK